MAKKRAESDQTATATNGEAEKTTSEPSGLAPKAKAQGKKGIKKKPSNAVPKGPKPKRNFPTYSLKEALVIAEAFRKARSGDEAATDLIAKTVGLSRTNPKFFYLAAASRDYGLTTGGRDTQTMTLQDLGKQIVKARTQLDEHQAKVKAFLSVEPFAKLFQHYKQLADLPEEGKYLTNLLEQDLNLPPAFHTEFLRIVKENCTYLGITETTTVDADSPPVQTEDNKAGQTRALAVAQKPLAFVIMPFTEKMPARSKGFFTELLEKLIEPACVEAGFTVETAIQKGSDVIQSTIINKLLKAELVVCDLTDHNPNVLFELGIRIARKLPVALIKSNDTGAIFDVDNMMRVETYNPNLWISTVATDLPKLTAHIKGAWDNRESALSYIDILQKPETHPLVVS